MLKPINHAASDLWSPVKRPFWMGQTWFEQLLMATLCRTCIHNLTATQPAVSEEKSIMCKVGHRAAESRSMQVAPPKLIYIIPSCDQHLHKIWWWYLQPFLRKRVHRHTYDDDDDDDVRRCATTIAHRWAKNDSGTDLESKSDQGDCFSVSFIEITPAVM